MTGKTMFGDPIKPGWKCSIKGCETEIGDPENRMNVEIGSPYQMDGEGRVFHLCLKHIREILAILEPVEPVKPDPVLVSSESKRDKSLCQICGNKMTDHVIPKPNCDPGHQIWCDVCGWWPEGVRK